MYVALVKSTQVLFCNDRHPHNSSNIIILVPTDVLLYASSIVTCHIYNTHTSVVILMCVNLAIEGKGT